MPQRSVQITKQRSVCTIRAWTGRSRWAKWSQAPTRVFFSSGMIFPIRELEVNKANLYAESGLMFLNARCDRGCVTPHPVQVIIWWMTHRLSNNFSLSGRLNENRALIVYSSSEVIDPVTDDWRDSRSSAVASLQGHSGQKCKDLKPRGLQ